MKYPSFKDLILFENDDYIVVNKPPFVASLDERGGSGEVNILRLAKQYSADAQVCHRLDKETSGAIIIAKTPEAYRSVAMQFEKRKVNKVYHAVVDGQFTFNELFIDLPILNDGNKSVTIDRKEGKRAETIFNSIKNYRHYTLVECKPITGRMHQIRIHLATQRAAIAGDDMYRGKPVFLSSMKKGYRIAKDDEELPIMKRFALHARHLVFKGLDGADIVIDAPYPKDFATLIKLLDKFDA
ncbi:23S rRNA pseudouridine955/2504/2580 synthase [Pedobacter steynii]|uniref:23S rRNA pseudouridine955/2504/2580 synthase n=1 Tax=Pedobacter steynii TaxID=430522 RepID=A0A1H0BJE9_9SPHI|nr:RluA family pseudouridine synthase [Pedobacter steynii]NQX41042.1 RluA family pseudouridine synthase [Pedobacter steynii]SDN45563.1 23S rRNA pseudouridine955/2504/2580 synthase [Pedobacter steynii]